MSETWDVRLDCGRCVLRPWRRDDLESLLRHANNPRVAASMRDRFPHPYTEADGMAWLESTAQDRSELRLAIDVDGEAVGGIGLMPQDDVHAGTAEIGYWVGESYWNRGIATAAVSALTRHALAILGHRRLYAWTFAPNIASQRVLEKSGFRREGLLRQSAIKRGIVLDQALYGCIAGDLTVMP